MKLPRLPRLWGDDAFEPAARDLEARAHRLSRRPENARDVGNEDVVLAIAQFVRVLGRANATAGRLTWVLIILTVATVTLVVFQMYDAQQTMRLQTALSLNSEFFNNANNLRVISAIEGGGPLLKENNKGGVLSETQIDHYIGEYETIDEAYRGHALTEDMLCDFFSDYVLETYDHPELRAYVAMSKKMDPLYFEGLDHLYQVVKASKDPRCK